MNPIWILTREVNEYDQEGAYFVAAFLTKPTAEEIRAVTWTQASDEFIGHLLNGGGREREEHEWYWLTQFQHGERA